MAYCCQNDQKVVLVAGFLVDESCIIHDKCVNQRYKIKKLGELKQRCTNHYTIKEMYCVRLVKPVSRDPRPRHWTLDIQKSSAIVCLLSLLVPHLEILSCELANAGSPIHDSVWRVLLTRFAHSSLFIYYFQVCVLVAANYCAIN